MAVSPKAIPRIRKALRLYKVSSVITGVFLLLLVVMMVLRYGFHVDIELGGPQGFLALVPKEQIIGINLSIGILAAHGWFYLLYIFADFQLWSTLRWSFWRFVLIALGGVIPFLSFVAEHHYAKIARAELAALEAQGSQTETVEASHQ
jgi:integral membrane protein